MRQCFNSRLQDTLGRALTRAVVGISKGAKPAIDA